MPLIRGDSLAAISGLDGGSVYTTQQQHSAICGVSSGSIASTHSKSISKLSTIRNCCIPGSSSGSGGGGIDQHPGDDGMLDFSRPQKSATIRPRGVAPQHYHHHHHHLVYSPSMGNAPAAPCTRKVHHQMIAKTPAACGAAADLPDDPRWRYRCGNGTMVSSASTTDIVATTKRCFPDAGVCDAGGVMIKRENPDVIMMGRAHTIDGNRKSSVHFAPNPIVNHHQHHQHHLAHHCKTAETIPTSAQPKNTTDCLLSRTTTL